MTEASQAARLLTGPLGYQQGWQQLLRPADPAAGANYDYTVSGQYHERVLAVQASFTASATVATRDVILYVRDALSNRILAVPGADGVAAGASNGITWADFGVYNSFANSGEIIAPLPGLLLSPGWQVNIEVANIQAGDQLSGIAYLVQRFPTDITRLDAVP